MRHRCSSNSRDGHSRTHDTREGSSQERLHAACINNTPAPTSRPPFPSPSPSDSVDFFPFPYKPDRPSIYIETRNHFRYFLKPSRSQHLVYQSSVRLRNKWTGGAFYTFVCQCAGFLELWCDSFNFFLIFTPGFLDVCGQCAGFLELWYESFNFFLILCQVEIFVHSLKARSNEMIANLKAAKTEVDRMQRRKKRVDRKHPTNVLCMGHDSAIGKSWWIFLTGTTITSRLVYKNTTKTSNVCTSL